MDKSDKRDKQLKSLDFRQISYDAIQLWMKHIGHVMSD